VKRERPAGKPEAFRHVLRQSRELYFISLRQFTLAKRPGLCYPVFHR